MTTIDEKDLQPFDQKDKEKDYIVSHFKEKGKYYLFLSPREVKPELKSKMYRFGVFIDSKPYWLNEGKYVTYDRAIAKQTYLSLVEKYGREEDKSVVIFMAKK